MFLVLTNITFILALAIIKFMNVIYTYN